MISNRTATVLARMDGHFLGRDTARLNEVARRASGIRGALCIGGRSRLARTRNFRRGSGVIVSTKSKCSWLAVRREDLAVQLPTFRRPANCGLGLD
jgi:hypothetical protein